MRIVPVVVMASALLSMASPEAGAQQSAAEPHEKDCDKAAKTVENGHPAHKLTASLEALLGCGAVGAHATAAAVLGSRSDADTATLERFYQLADLWRDDGIMQAATDVARDAGATVPARVYAIRHLQRILSPHVLYRFGDLVRGDQRGAAADSTEVIEPGCRHVRLGTAPTRSGTPLAADADARITAVLDALAANSTADARIRHAAACRW